MTAPLIVMPQDACVEVAGETLVLMPERAAWWPRARTLLVADVHLGKSAVFRAHGLAIPGGSTEENFARLARCIDRYRAERLLCLGDLTHARAGHTPRLLARLAAFRAHYSALQIDVLQGNHDRHAGIPGVLGARLVEGPLQEGPFLFMHEPPAPHASLAGYALAGHVHPAIVLQALSDRLRVPAFVLEAHGGLLPAFGAFTGMHTLELKPGCRYYAALDDKVIGPIRLAG